MNAATLEKIFPRGYWVELKAIITLAMPVMVTYISQQLNFKIAIMFSGRLGYVRLGAASMANSIFSVFGQAIAVGMATACDTLFSQIYGSKHRNRLGIVLIRSLMILSLCSLLPISLFLNAENVLLMLGQEPDIARLTAEYLLYMTPCLLLAFQYAPLLRYLLNQDIKIPCMIIGFLGNIMNILFHYILVIYLGYGLIGSAVSQVIAYSIYVGLTLAYVIFKSNKATWPGWSAESFLDWAQFFWLGIYGLVMICVEYWVCAASLMISGWLGTTELAAQSVMFMSEMMLYLVPMGVSIAASIRIGHFLGANDPEGAKTCYWVIASLTCFLSVVFAVSVYCLRYYLPLMTTTVPDIVEMVANTLPWYALITLFEGIYVVGAGILRGSGRQNIGSIIPCVGYAIGLTVGITLLVRKCALKGFWQGMLAANVIEAIMMCVVLFRTDWEQQATQAAERVTVSTETKLDVNGSARDLHYGSINDPLDHPQKGEIHALIPEETTSKHVPVRVYIRTCLVVLAVLVVLVAGVACRILLPTLVPSPHRGLGNGTHINNTDW